MFSNIKMIMRKDIPGYEGYYQVSDTGKVKSLRTLKRDKVVFRERILKDRINSSGYLAVVLYKDSKKKSYLVHRLVYCVFKNIPLEYKGHKSNTLVCHKDDNKINNTLRNLFLGTHQDNQNDMYKKGRGNKEKGEDRYCAKLKENDVLRIRSLIKKGIKHIDIAKAYNVSRPTITAIGCRRTWKHI